MKIFRADVPPAEARCRSCFHESERIAISPHQEVFASTDSKYTHERLATEPASPDNAVEQFHHLAQVFDHSCTRVLQGRHFEINSELNAPACSARDLAFSDFASLTPSRN